MVKITLGIEGMACGMCEAYINDTVRASFKVKKVTSSHSKGETVIVAENEIDESALKAAIKQVIRWFLINRSLMRKKAFSQPFANNCTRIN